MVVPTDINVSSEVRLSQAEHAGPRAAVCAIVLAALPTAAVSMRLSSVGEMKIGMAESEKMTRVRMLGPRAP